MRRAARIGQDLAVAVAELLQQPRRPLDIDTPLLRAPLREFFAGCR
jgi:hypothetical protein